MITLLPCPYSNYLHEAFQSNEIKFAFVNYTDKENEYQVLMPFVKCREYFNELLMANAHEDFKFEEVYGFNYQTKYKLNQDEILMVVKYPSKNHYDNSINNLHYLHKLEEFNGIVQKTSIELIQVDKKTYVTLVKASKAWMQKCLTFNLYTMLLKLLALDYPNTSTLKIAQASGTAISEITYINTVSEDSFKKLIHNIPTIIEYPSKYIDGSNEKRHPYNVHAYSGIIAMLISSETSDATKDFRNFLKNLIKKDKTQYVW